MEVKICRGCKKMFQYISGPILCPKCRELEEEMFRKVKLFLQDHPGADFVEINKETGVTIAMIERFLKEGRLEVTADSPMHIKCERCGKTIKTGRYCAACRTKMNKTIEKMKQSMMPEAKKDDNEKAKMHYLKSENINH